METQMVTHSFMGIGVILLVLLILLVIFAAIAFAVIFFVIKKSKAQSPVQNTPAQEAPNANHKTE